MAFKMAKQGSDITGENFDSAMSSGFKKYKQDSGPFVRSLGHMKDRNAMLMGQNDEQAQYGWERYDGKDTVNQA